MNKLSEWWRRRKEEYHRGVQITLEKKIKRQMKKQQFITPGTLRYGMMNKQSIGELMKDAWEMRKQKRLEKYHKDKED